MNSENIEVENPSPLKVSVVIKVDSKNQFNTGATVGSSVGLAETLSR